MIFTIFHYVTPTQFELLVWNFFAPIPFEKDAVNRTEQAFCPQWHTVSLQGEHGEQCPGTPMLTMAVTVLSGWHLLSCKTRRLEKNLSRNSMNESMNEEIQKP